MLSQPAHSSDETDCGRISYRHPTFIHLHPNLPRDVPIDIDCPSQVSNGMTLRLLSAPFSYQPVVRGEGCTALPKSQREEQRSK